MKFKTGDQVIITSGKDKGKTGEITKVYPKKHLVVVKGSNMYKRHLKSREGIEGGILELERPLPTAKIAILDPIENKPTRVGYQTIANGSKLRTSKISGTDLDKKTSKPVKKATKKKN